MHTFFFKQVKYLKKIYDIHNPNYIFKSYNQTLNRESILYFVLSCLVRFLRKEC